MCKSFHLYRKLSVNDLGVELTTCVTKCSRSVKLYKSEEDLQAKSRLVPNICIGLQPHYSIGLIKMNKKTTCSKKLGETSEVSKLTLKQLRELTVPKKHAQSAKGLSIMLINPGNHAFRVQENKPSEGFYSLIKNENCRLLMHTK